MRRRTLLCFLLLLLIVAILATACVDGGSGARGATEGAGASGAAANGTPVPQNIQATLSADATATFGAQEFNAQLTAIAGKKNQP